MVNKQNILAACCMMTLLACTSSPEQDDYDDESKTTSVTRVGGGLSQPSKKIKLPLSVDHGLFGLMGTPADAYSVDLDGCMSLYAVTVTDADGGDIEVYKDDRDCLAKLTEFEIGGTVYAYNNAGATDFTTWLANDTALFTSVGGATIRVKVVSQLDSPITGTEAVVYNFSELLDGTGDYVFSEAEVSDSHLIEIESQEAPLFDVVTASFLGLDDLTGAPEFDFKMECVDDPTDAMPTSVAMAAGSGADTLCSENDLEDLSYTLVKDTYGSDLTITEAEAIFDTPTTTIVTPTLPDDQYQDSGTNEGFHALVDGPGPLGTAGNENMILIIKAGISFTYYNIDVTTITQ